MKKIILLASALVLGGTAYAQDATMPPATSGSAMPAAPSPAPMTPDASMPPATTPDSATPAASAPAPTTPDAAAPAAPAAAPSTTPTQGAADLPTCSKTVTDSCKQGGSSTHHKAKRKK